MTADSPTSRLRTTARRPLLPLAVAVATGIVADRVFDVWLGEHGLNGYWLNGHGLSAWWAAAIGCLVLSVWMASRRHSHSNHSHSNMRLAMAALLLATACIGGSWHHLRWHYYEQDHLARFATDVSQPVCLRAVAVDRTKYSPAPPTNPLRAIPVGPRSEINVRITSVRNGREWRDAEGTCKLRVNGELNNVIAGDELLVFGLMGTSAPALNPGEYDWSLAARGAGRHCELFGAVLLVCC